MGWLKDFVFKLIKIRKARGRRIYITEPLTFRENVLKNQIWYRGDPAELEQFFKQSAFYDIDKARFWASVPHGRVRKIHSGIVSIVIDRYKDIVTSDMNKISFGEEGDDQPIKDLWDKIAEDCSFTELIGTAVSGALSSADGAFKISIDENNQFPVIDFYEADRVDFVRKGRKITEIKFYTEYNKGEKEYQLEETYGIGYVKYKLFDDSGKEVPIDTLEELKSYSESDTSFDADFMMAVPLIIFPSTKWKGRGKALFDAKTDNLDALDEVISQWLDAIRMGRVKRYIPEDMVPRNPDTGELIEANPFDNDYIAVGSIKAEGDTGKIDISQPQISYEAYVNSYSNFLDLVLQGIISPATLGIDLKKTDNAQAQREKEKITLHTRGKIVDVLNEVIPQLIETVLKVYDLMYGPVYREYEAIVEFGEYAAPDFGSAVETVVKAKTGGVMSTEQSVEELYGDTKDEEWKQQEVLRLKNEQGIQEMEEPGINLEAGEFQVKGFQQKEGGAEDESQGGKQNISDEPKRVSGASGSSKTAGANGNLRGGKN